MVSKTAEDLGGGPATVGGVLVRRGLLALSLEEILTVACRIRRGQNVGRDPDEFRASAKAWLSTAARKGQSEGYSEDPLILAGYAAVAFLDESVLNSSDPMFSDWHRRPLQAEIFGDFLAGERFFQNLDLIMRMQETEEAADLLEVHLLCLALGFQGQFAAMGPGGLMDLRHRWEKGRDRLISIRGGFGDLSPSWNLPEQGELPPVPDPVTKRLVMATAASAVVFSGLWVFFYFVLRSGTASIIGGT